MNNNTNINILVYLSNNIDAVKKCVESLLRYTSAVNITFVGDNLNRTIHKYLLTQCGKQNGSNTISLLNSHIRLGFAVSMNRAIRCSNTPYVLLMRDDIIVTRNWIDNMFECMKRDSSIGIVCPLLNGGFRQNICEQLPKNYTIDSFADLIFKKSQKQYPKIDSAEACILIKKSVINKVGVLNNTSHAEVEYSCRIHEAGFKIVIADNTFVYCKSKSRSKIIKKLSKELESVQKNVDSKLIQKKGATIESAPLKQNNSRRLKGPLLELSKTIKFLSPSDLDRETGHHWGDHWVKQDLTYGFQRLGWNVVSAGEYATTSLLLYGGFLDSSSPIRAVWIYSHPSNNLAQLLDYSNFDVVYTLSTKHLQEIKNQREDAKILLPATSKIYYPPKKKENKKYDVLLLGNASKEMRVRAIKRLVKANRFKIGIIGGRWKDMIGQHIKQEHYLGTYWDNQKYPELFNQAKTTIYIHHEDMRLMNFVAVRILDIIACSNCMVLSDENAGLKELGLNMIPTFSDDRSKDGGPKSVVKVVDQYLNSNNKKIIISARNTIRKYHTFDQRVKQLSLDLEKAARQKGIKLI